VTATIAVAHKRHDEHLTDRIRTPTSEPFEPFEPFEPLVFYPLGYGPFDQWSAAAGAPLDKMSE
jgi:hypothetical protein